MKRFSLFFHSLLVCRIQAAPNMMRRHYCIGHSPKDEVSEEMMGQEGGGQTLSLPITPLRGTYRPTLEMYFSPLDPSRPVPEFDVELDLENEDTAHEDAVDEEGVDGTGDTQGLGEGAKTVVGGSREPAQGWDLT